MAVYFSLLVYKKLRAVCGSLGESSGNLGLSPTGSVDYGRLWRQYRAAYGSLQEVYGCAQEVYSSIWQSRGGYLKSRGVYG